MEIKELKTEDLTIEEGLTTVFESLKEILQVVDELKTQQAEIIEKLANLSLDTEGYSYED